MNTRRRYPQRPLALVAALLLTLGAMVPNLAMASVAGGGAAVEEGPGQRLLLCTPDGMRWVTLVDGAVVPDGADRETNDLPPCPGCVLSALAGLAPPAPSALTPARAAARMSADRTADRAPRGPPPTQ
ncbi:hypothetical protein CCR80_06550, partial [Rhodothalassium salexigens]